MNDSKTIYYVAGLLFSENRDEVLLIKKNRPEWQTGKYNAIGGKIEPGETSLQAMEREFHEETGVRGIDWKRLCTLVGDTWIVNFFYAFSDKLYSAISITDEPIRVFSAHEVCNYWALMRNLKIFIPLALDESGIEKPIIFIDKTQTNEEQRELAPSSSADTTTTSQGYTCSEADLKYLGSHS